MSGLRFGKMDPLPAADVRYLVVHTEGAPSGKHGTAKSIHDYHRSKGWAGIGYHRVIGEEGKSTAGRPEKWRGAHVEGLNACSFGIVCTGNGDLEDFSPAQMTTLVHELVRRMIGHGVPIERVIGHREAYALPGVPFTGKSCPGSKVSMKAIRTRVIEELADLWPEPRIVVPARRER